MAEDLAERTEAPTPKRLMEARMDGTIARSADLSGALMLLGATVMLAFAFFPMLGGFKKVMEAVLGGDTLGNPVDPTQAQTVIEYVAVSAIRIGLPILLLTALMAFVIQYTQVGWLFSPRILKPSLNKLNPVSGFKRLFAISALFKAGMSVLKVTVVGAVVVVTVYQYRKEIVVLAYLSPLQSISRTCWMMLDMAMRLLAVLLVLGVADYLYQRWKHTRDLRMTKHQIKDEMKQTEGDPQVKRRRLRMAQQIAMQRIAAAVPRADVVVTNPDHISIAIQYDAEKMNAPTVIAKGADILALRIRQLALLNDIPIVERPPLARALYRQVAVGQEVPPDFYHTVAEILAYVYRLSGKMAG